MLLEILKECEAEMEMINPILVPFLAEHLLQMRTRDTTESEPWSLMVDKERRGPAYTALVENRVVACAGVMLLWPGVGMAWANVGEDFPSIQVWGTRMTRRIFRDAMRAHHLHRLEATVLADSERNQRYLRLMGFSQENGKATAYTPDKRDAVRYQLVRG